MTKTKVFHIISLLSFLIIFNNKMIFSHGQDKLISFWPSVVNATRSEKTNGFECLVSKELSHLVKEGVAKVKPKVS